MNTLPMLAHDAVSQRYVLPSCHGTHWNGR